MSAVESEKRQRHKWPSDPRRIPACDAPDGNDRNERVCLLCGLVKITVIAPRGAWREWRGVDGTVWRFDKTPGCAASK